MLYHDISNLSFNQDKNNASIDLKTGYYGFHFNGGWVQGNLVRIGSDTILIDSPVMGKIVMGKEDFINSGFQKL